MGAAATTRAGTCCSGETSVIPGFLGWQIGTSLELLDSMLIQLDLATAVCPHQPSERSHPEGDFHYEDCECKQTNVDNKVKTNRGEA